MLNKINFSALIRLAFVPSGLVFAFLFFSCKSDVNTTDNESTITLSERISSGTSSYTLVDDFDFYPSSTTNQIVNHDYYTLSYHEEHEQAEWVAYVLQPQKGINRNYNRPYFIEDPNVTSKSADWRNYKNSGYTKGHLCPAGDMRFSKKAYDATFYTSNISPQLPEFNGGVWNRLEQKIRYWADKYGDIYVITGGVLSEDLKSIGRDNVSVPNYFYKILLHSKGDQLKMIGFLVPHKDSDRPLYEFVVPVDKIEQMTGIDFFKNLPDGIENTLEKSSDYKDWSFN
jgi:endonuclease G